MLCEHARVIGTPEYLPTKNSGEEAANGDPLKSLINCLDRIFQTVYLQSQHERNDTIIHIRLK